MPQETVSEMRPPSKLLWAAEVPRAALTLLSLLRSRAMLGDVPRGDGRPILLLPGLFNSDRSNVVLRRYLSGLGYRTDGWGLGRNFGTRAIGPDAEKLFARIRAIDLEALRRARDAEEVPEPRQGTEDAVLCAARLQLLTR